MASRARTIRKRSLPRSLSPASDHEEISSDSPLPTKPRGEYPAGIIIGLWNHKQLMDCKLDNFNSFDEYWAAFEMRFNDFNQLSREPVYDENWKVFLFAMNLGPRFGTFLMSPGLDDYKIGSFGAGENMRFSDFVFRVRNYGLVSARYEILNKAMGGTFGDLNKARYVPKWMFEHNHKTPHHLARLGGPFKSACTLPGHARSPHTNGECRTQCPHLRIGYIPDERDLEHWYY